MFVETSASPDYIAALKLALISSDMVGIAVFFAGASPGITNLMADHLAVQYPSTSKIDIAVEIGLGRGHGGAGVQWFLEALAKPYPVIFQNQRRTVHVGDFKRRFVFEESEEDRLAIGYGFVDQLAIAEQFQALSSVRLFMALDPPWVLRLLQFCITLKLGNLIACNAAQIQKTMGAFKGVGKVRTRFMVEGTDDRGNVTKVLRISSGDQAEVTAIVLATLLRTLIKPGTKFRRGICDITDILSLGLVVSALKIEMPETKMIDGTVQYSQGSADQKRNYL